MARINRCQNVDGYWFLGVKITGGMVAAFLLAHTSVCYSQTNYTPDQPSIDCSKARNAVARILCSGPEGARADWELNSTLWALYFTVDEKSQPMLDNDQQSWRQSLDQTCALPRQQTEEEQAGQVMAQTMGQFIFGQGIRVPAPQLITQAQVNCVLKAYHARAASLRSRLAGDALAESQLSPEQHSELQDALTEKGFLPPDQIGMGTHDGEFGPITRKAIKQFQRSVDASPSGFLSGEQKIALLERPGEREAKLARAATDAKMREAAPATQATANSEGISEEDSPNNRVAHMPLITLARWTAILKYCSTKFDHSYNEVIQNLTVYTGKVENHYPDKDYTDKLLKYFSEPSNNKNISSTYQYKGSCDDVAHSAADWINNGRPFGDRLVDSPSPNKPDDQKSDLTQLYLAYLFLHKCDQRFNGRYAAKLSDVKRITDQRSSKYDSKITDDLWNQVLTKWNEISSSPLSFDNLSDREAIENCQFFANSLNQYNQDVPEKP